MLLLRQNRVLARVTASFPLLPSAPKSALLSSRSSYSNTISIAHPAVSPTFTVRNMSDDSSTKPTAAADAEADGKKEQKSYHKKATGLALQTVRKHSKDNDLKLFGSCFCPFVQRVWIALELKGIDYQYIEVDPYAKPKLLTDINPRGLVPALRHGDWGCYESTVLLEYLEDLQAGAPLLPTNARERADTRLWIDHTNRNIVPGFYRLLQAQEAAKQIEYAAELKNEISKLVGAASQSGPFFAGPTPTLVDVSIAPWLLRLSRVLHPYRGWPLPDPSTRLGRWIGALEASDAVRNTLSDDSLYLDSYERYAEESTYTAEIGMPVSRGTGSSTSQGLHSPSSATAK